MMYVKKDPLKEDTTVRGCGRYLLQKHEIDQV